ncbi:MAG: TRAP transporter substrate-binding protein DctP [Acidobacteria bacterium]|nr:TRAP transporter substrate-binding protein DctP [Acidobacteriota bacterium]
MKRTGNSVPLALLVALLLVSALLGSAVGCDLPRHHGEIWRFAIEETAGSVQDAYAQRFKQMVENGTGGEVEVLVYPYGALGTSDHITEQLHNGTLELAMSSPGHLGKLLPEVQVFLLHFVLSDDERVNAEALRDPELHDYLDDLYAEKGLAFLTAFGEGWQVWTTQRQVKSPEDFDGMRFRVMTSPLLVASYQAYGASPTPLPYAEVYSALQLHMIDGQVNPVFAIEEMSFYEVTRWMTFARQAEFITTVAANPAFLEGLSPERRELVDDVVDRLQTEIFEIQERYNRERLEQIETRRPELHVTRLTPEQRERFRQRALEVRKRYVEMTGPRGQHLLDLLDEAVKRAEARLGTTQSSKSSHPGDGASTSSPEPSPKEAS